MADKYKVRVTDAGKADLDEILEYIETTFQADETAVKLLAEFQKLVLSLDEYPQRFSYSLESSLAERGYRRVMLKNYVILFQINEETLTVNIARIFHGSMDYPKYI